MTTAPRTARRRSRKQRAAKSSQSASPVAYCGLCAGWGAIWCDGCCGFDGCALCGWTYRRPCPLCTGGNAGPIEW
ncbi:hypothetical protein GCM10009549_18220 [Streptomyces thermoalcalitolerans]|uniref:Uncharacterized protein n=1 Tax=Streptomyces thermoalcalitolerans TaxID=65605 RepID=A0ABP3YZZ6_9ACTN